MTWRRAVKSLIGAMGYVVIGKKYADEVVQANARLRDERDRLKAMLETATAEARRPRSVSASPRRSGLRPESAGASTNAAQARSAARRAAGSQSSIRLVCVGTGRDGTTSLAHMIQTGFDARGRGESANHEWASVPFNAAFCEWMETGDSVHQKRIRAALRDCPNDAIVGNGYAAILPTIAESLAGGATLVHLRRRDRSACVASLARNATLYPVNHLYYADSPTATGKRMAAFHFGEMSRAEWDRLTLIDKFGWYYDKTHALVEQYAPLFERTIEVETESLRDEAVGAALARVVGADAPLRAVHLNRHVEVDAPSMQARVFVQRLLGKLDVDRLASDELYGARHFLGEYLHYLSELASGIGPGDSTELDPLVRTLSEARVLLRSGMVELIDIENRLRGAQGPVVVPVAGETRVA
jgi:hypothetical protein